ncbi:MAG: hypothetical protein AB1531_02190, partial [Chloroflexota bacterium]
TWEKYQFALEVGGVIVAEGKVDAQSSPAKVLVDNIRTQIKLTDPAQSPAEEPSQMPLRPAADRQPVPDKKPPQQRGRVRETPAVYKKAAPAVGKTRGGPDSERRPEPVEGPPPPEDPPEWQTYTPSAGNSDSASLSAAEAGLEVPVVEPPETDLPEEPLSVVSGQLPAGSAESSPLSNIESHEPIAPKLSPITPPPLSLDEEHPPQMVTVTLRSSGDAERDIRRISRLHGAFISFPGKDRFQFQIFEEGKGHLIDFPNDTTRVCPELLRMAKDFVREENLRVEPITYQ